MSLFFTADTHFCHANIIGYCKRPFGDVLEMNEVIIKNWNRVVTDKDLVYHLGDFGFGEFQYILNELHGEIVLVQGNHEEDALVYRSRFKEVHDLLEIKHEKQRIVLCHFAMRRWSSSHHGTWHLYGHSHGTCPPYGKSFDVGVDCNDFTPISFEQVAKRMKALADNADLLKGK